MSSHCATAGAWVDVDDEADDAAFNGDDYETTVDQEPGPEPDEDDPFDHGGCYQPHVRSGEYYDCDGRPI